MALAHPGGAGEAQTGQDEVLLPVCPSSQQWSPGRAMGDQECSWLEKEEEDPAGLPWQFSISKSSDYLSPDLFRLRESLEGGKRVGI